jgi:hypothetical protein
MCLGHGGYPSDRPGFDAAVYTASAEAAGSFVDLCGMSHRPQQIVLVSVDEAREYGARAESRMRDDAL